MSRGLVEPVGDPGILHGRKWRLSTIGVKAARRLYPEVTPPAKAQIKRELKQTDAKRKSARSGEHRSPKLRKIARKAPGAVRSGTQFGPT
jgi:hypothetical protein